ncbi:sugar-binding transcriptional regulator [Parafrigoribacterium soli]|uniref:sugar-binding transcriptional regulator n=1 Tax=Parafrigoribacterium soli TaxID=3144663 RepID=UPI0032ED8BA6
MFEQSFDDLRDKTAPALKAAQLYYVHNLTMDTIAQELQTSRSTVSRLLSFARKTGLVDIQIRSPHDHSSSLKAAIQARFSVVAHIVSVPGNVSAVDRLERVSMSAARLLSVFIDSNMIIGVAWGSTVTAVTRHLVPKNIHNTEFIQLNGAGNIRTSGVVYASEILRRFGATYSANIEQFPAPAFFDNPTTKEAFWNERSTRHLLNIQEQMDMAIFSVGSPFSKVPSHVYIGGYLDPEDIQSLADSGVVGDVATVFFRADGSYEDVPLNLRATGPDFAVLKRVARRVCIVSGVSKLASLKGALAAGLITDLIVDEATARALAES